MHLVLLVEEESAEVTLQSLLPRLLPGEITYQINRFQGKTDLLRELPSRLRAYRRWIPPDWRIVVLVDRDNDDCLVLKRRLEEIAQAGFTTKSGLRHQTGFEVMNRVAVEELESWFLGDPDALVAAYPNVSRSFAATARYRDPDRIRGGTWEALERLLQRAGYHKGGLPKIAAARQISARMAPERNRSKSFAVFRDGLRSLLAPGRTV